MVGPVSENRSPARLRFWHRVIPPSGRTCRRRANARQRRATGRSPLPGNAIDGEIGTPGHAINYRAVNDLSAIAGRRAVQKDGDGRGGAATPLSAICGEPARARQGLVAAVSSNAARWPSGRSQEGFENRAALPRPHGPWRWPNSREMQMITEDAVLAGFSISRCSGASCIAIAAAARLPGSGHGIRRGGIVQHGCCSRTLRSKCAMQPLASPGNRDGNTVSRPSPAA